MLPVANPSSPSFLNVCKIDSDQQSASNEPLQGEFMFSDSPGPLFSMYYKAAVEEDRKMTKQSATNELPQGEFTFGDSSGPLFAIYSKATGEEDRKMVKRWQKYADGVFIFVSPCVGILIVSCSDQNAIDWLILCRSRSTPYCDSPGPEAKQPGYLRILPREYL